MNTHPTPKMLFWTLLCSGSLLLLYVAYRAYDLSMTHDESNTYMWFKDVSVWTCFYTKECWPNANNHLLNTFLYQISVAIFGEHTLAIRLPNVLAFAIYIYISMRLVLSYAPSLPIGVAAFFLLCGNPYFLDFFSVARGYGLSAAMGLISIYYLFQYTSDQHVSKILGCFTFGFLSVLANFVALNFWIGLCLVFFLFNLFLVIQKSISLGTFALRHIIPVAFTLLLAGLLIKPLFFLQEVGDFKYGVSNIFTGLGSMVQNSFYIVKYLGPSTFLIGLVIYLVLVVMLTVLGLYKVLRNRISPNDWKFILVGSLLFLCLVTIQIQNWVLGTQIPDHRKTTIWMMMSGVLFAVSLLTFFSQKKKWPSYSFGTIVTLCLVYHLFRVGNLDYCLEWYYDRSTKQVVEYLENEVPIEERPIKIGASWQFAPALNYYHHLYKATSFSPPAYTPEIKLNPEIDYYYIFQSDYQKLEANYQIDQPLPSGILLLKRK